MPSRFLRPRPMLKHQTSHRNRGITAAEVARVSRRCSAFIDRHGAYLVTCRLRLTCVVSEVHFCDTLRSRKKKVQRSGLILFLSVKELHAKFETAKYIV